MCTAQPLISACRWVCTGKSSELQLKGKPSTILVVGVNGAGKTTTIGKLAYKFSQEGAKASEPAGSVIETSCVRRRSKARLGVCDVLGWRIPCPCTSKIRPGSPERAHMAGQLRGQARGCPVPATHVPS